MKRIVLLVLLVTTVGCADGQETTDPETTTTATSATTSGTEAVTTTQPLGDGETPSLSITIAAFRFSGDDTGTIGDTVEVTNSDSVGHTWTSTDGAFHSGVLSSGDTFAHTFEAAGTYPFFCQIHPEMSGSITIEG